MESEDRHFGFSNMKCQTVMTTTDGLDCFISFEHYIIVDLIMIERPIHTCQWLNRQNYAVKSPERSDHSCSSGLSC